MPSCFRRLSFQGRGSKAYRKTVSLFQPSSLDTWTDGVRNLKFLFSRPSQKPVNQVYPEDMPHILETFGSEALAGLQIQQERTKQKTRRLFVFAVPRNEP